MVGLTINKTLWLGNQALVGANQTLVGANLTPFNHSMIAIKVRVGRDVIKKIVAVHRSINRIELSYK